MNVVPWSFTEYLIHVANVIFVLSFSVKDILYLRILTVLGLLCLIPYFLFHIPDPLWPSMYWNMAFITVNVVRIAMLCRERWPVRFSKEESWLYETVFGSLTPWQFAKLIRPAVRKEAIATSPLVRRGEPVDHLMLIIAGSVSAEVDDHQVALLGPGQFVGEMAFITNETASATAITTEATRFVDWPRDRLEALLESDRELRDAMYRVLGADVINKLKQMNWDKQESKDQ